MKNFKISTLVTITLYVMLVVMFSGCVEIKSENLLQKKIGVARNATVVTTSFNETPKVQIKTDSQFFVVCSFPILTIGDSLTGLYSDSELKYIIDNRGKQFRVL
jgi:hypothetical protein